VRKTLQVFAQRQHLREQSTLSFSAYAKEA
jgi:hypothetical protein